jgi:hypothetical protein
MAPLRYSVLYSTRVSEPGIDATGSDIALPTQLAKQSESETAKHDTRRYSSSDARAFITRGILDKMLHHTVNRNTDKCRSSQHIRCTHRRISRVTGTVTRT